MPKYYLKNELKFPVSDKQSSLKPRTNNQYLLI